MIYQAYNYKTFQYHMLFTIYIRLEYSNGYRLLFSKLAMALS